MTSNIEEEFQEAEEAIEESDNPPVEGLKQVLRISDEVTDGEISGDENYD